MENHHGIIIKHNREKGYGFIRTRELDEDIFFHISDLANPAIVAVGRKVTFELQNSEKGYHAKQVVMGGYQKSPLFAFGCAAFFLLILLTIIFLVEFRLRVLYAYLLAVNFCTLTFYGYDKVMARFHFFRIPETLLHILTAAGGTPAAWAGQRFFHHKTIKESFQNKFWLIIILQLIVLILWNGFAVDSKF